MILKFLLRRKLLRWAGQVYALEHVGDGYKQGYLDALQDVHDNM